MCNNKPLTYSKMYLKERSSMALLLSKKSYVSKRTLVVEVLTNKTTSRNSVIYFSFLENAIVRKVIATTKVKAFIH